MKRIALAVAVSASAFLAPVAANACTFETCWFTAPVCTRVNCNVRVCYYEPGGAQKCLIP